MLVLTGALKHQNITFLIQLTKLKCTSPCSYEPPDWSQQRLKPGCIYRSRLPGIECELLKGISLFSPFTTSAHIQEWSQCS